MGELQSWDLLTDTQEMNIKDWDRAPRELVLAPSSIRVEARLSELTEQKSAESVAAKGLAGSLGQVWAEVARRSLREGRSVFAWASRATLVGAAPHIVPEAQFADEGRKEAQTTGATLGATIHPAPDPPGTAWTDYRRWFPCAADIDNGRLRATAFYDQGLALRVATQLMRGGEHLSYDHRAGTLLLRQGGASLQLDVDALAFMGLMRGFLPEQMLAAAIQEAKGRMKRLESLITAVRGRIGAVDIRFPEGIPAFAVGSRVIMDPYARAYLEEGVLPDDWDERLSAAMTPLASTPCTCGDQQRIQAALRHRTEVYSFDNGRPASTPLFSPIGEAHCLVYQITCPHDVHRPDEEEWERAGWSRERCEQEWLTNPYIPDLFGVSSVGWLSQASLIYGIESGALAFLKDNGSGLAQAVGFSPSETLTVYVPNANLVFLTNADTEGETALRDYLRRSPLASVLQQQGRDLGPDVGYLGTIQVTASQPSLRVRRLEVSPGPIGKAL